MAMQMDSFKDDMEARCFLCLNRKSSKIQFPLDIRKEGVQVYSLRCLLNYLKLDRRKDKANGKLKAKLCAKCSMLIGKFSERFRKLEKIEMEISSSLQLIYGKLIKGEDRKKEKGEFSTPTKKTSILEDLRIATMKKCYRKIVTTRPRIKIKKLTPREVTLEIDKFRNNPSAQNSLPILSSQIMPESAIDIGCIKVETFPEFGDNSDDSNGADSKYSPHESDSSISGENVESDSNSEDEDAKADTRKKQEPVPGALPSKYPFILVAPPDSDTNEKIGQAHYTLIKEPQKRYQCKLCQKGYTARQNFVSHYKTVHLQYRYKCTFPSCDKHFPQAGHYYRHYECTHMGVRFKCPVCKRLFALKNHLKRHQQQNSCWRKPPQHKQYFCHCGKGFTKEHNLRYHMNEVHLERGKYGCELCSKKFNRKGNLIYHRRNVHHLPK